MCGRDAAFDVMHDDLRDDVGRAATASRVNPTIWVLVIQPRAPERYEQWLARPLISQILG